MARVTPEQKFKMREKIRASQGADCLIPSCTDSWLDVAHIDGSGSGGRVSTYKLDNLIGLCRHHHDIFDGHQLQGRQHLMRELMRFLADNARKKLIEIEYV
jgi:5-methylcytosine-specific restriction endonuclease McrA